MPYLDFEMKVEGFYRLTCENSRWQSIYSIAKRMGYKHTKAFDDVVAWLFENAFIEYREHPRPQGGIVRQVRPAMKPCEELNTNKFDM